MPSSYACVYSTNPNGSRVLIATKRQIGRWLGWNGTTYLLPFTTPLQTSQIAVGYAIISNPLQPVLPGGRVNTGESPDQCAEREFLEETGLYAPASTPVIVRFDQYGNIVSNQASSYSFAGVYWQIGDASLDSLTIAIQQNINNNNTGVISTADDELSGVQCLPKQNALSLFAANNVQGRPNLSTDWFTSIVFQIP